LRKESEERSFTPFRMTTSGKRLVRARFGRGEDERKWRVASAERRAEGKADPSHAKVRRFGMTVLVG